MKRNRKHKKNKPSKKDRVFHLAFRIYIAILFILAGLFLSYIKNTLIEYERSDPESYVKYAVQNIDKNILQKFIKDNDVVKDSLEISKNFILTDYQKIIKSKTTIQKVKDNTYDVFIKDRKMFTITIKEKKKVKKLGLLNYPIYEVQNIIPYLDRGLIYEDISVPSDYKVTINNKELTDKYITSLDKISGLSDMYYYENMPKVAKYQINNLTSEPKIIITNSKNEKINYTNTSYHINLENSFTKYDTYDEAIKHLSSEINILNIAEQWSLFLTRDLKGNNNGFATIKDYFIEGSSMYKTAHSWAYGIDITFTSNHRLTNPPFTNEKVSNFVIYDKNAFSCEVYLEKNMIVVGKAKVDVMHDYLYFIKYNGGWKLIKINAAKE